MIDQTTLLTYLAVLTGFVFLPGPAVLLTLARSASSGPRVGIATGLGIATGDVAHTAMAVFGLSAILSPAAGTESSAYCVVKGRPTSIEPTEIANMPMSTASRTAL